MRSQFQSIQTEVRTKILSKVVIGLSLAALGLVIAGVIMGITSMK
ncbi:MAG: hypothetical protein WCX88_01915 [Patescibacteria group bacterium]